MVAKITLTIRIKVCLEKALSVMMSNTEAMFPTMYINKEIREEGHGFGGRSIAWDLI